MRTSTLVLIVAFLAVWWVYDTYRPEPAPKPPAPQVVPPGFVPDPNYTWVPRSRVQQPPATDTFTPTPTTHAAAHHHRRRTTTTTPPPFVLPSCRACCRRPSARPARARLAPAAAATAAGARSGADIGATGQLTSRASEIHRYTGVP